MYVNPRMLIASAYNIQAFARSEVVGGPEWIDSQIYEIHSKINGSMSDAMSQMPSKQRQEKIALMEQSLLTNRFKLQTHFETRQLPEFALVVAKDGPKMHSAAAPSDTHGTMTRNPDGQSWDFKANGISIHNLASLLQMQPEIDGRLIVDQTGLAGAYDVKMDWTRDSGTAANIPASSQNETEPALFDAIQDQLGLRLVRIKGPAEVIVIDHIERPQPN
jgi:bla regulator protein blaR1